MGITLLASLAALMPLRASAIQATDYAGLRWRMIGPYHGGRATAVAGVQSESDTFYLGAAGGSIWRTEDGGRTWQPMFDGQPASSIGALAVDSADPKIIYAGTGECDMRSSIVAGNGMYKSIDAGKHWIHLGLVGTEQICRIVVDPKDSNSVYVAALGHAYGSNSERGVFHSIDGGKTWQKILYKDADTGAIDLAMDPSDSKVIYAAMWQTRRPPWNVYPPSNGPGSGLYKTTDGGATWQQLTNGLPRQGLGRITIAIARTQPDRVYLVVDARKGGLYGSDDAGVHWKLINGDFDKIWNRGWYFGVLAVDPQNANTIWTGNLSLQKSTDGGKRFSDSQSAPLEDFHGIWIAPDDPNHIIVGADQGAEITFDGGKEWSSNLDEPISQFYRIVTDNRFPYWVYGAQQDSGSLGLPSRAADSIGYEDMIQPGVGGENGYMAPDPLHPKVIFGSQGEGAGSVNVYNLDTEQYGDITPDIAFPGPHRKLWTMPVVFSQSEPHVLYFGREMLFRTANYGHSWTAISPDLTRPDPGVPPNLDPATANDLYGRARRGEIFTIAPSPLRRGEIWVGTTDGKIWLTHDEGKHWVDVTPPQVGSWSKVTLIEASPHDPRTAYAAVDRHRLDDFRPYLYRTHDGGRTWTLAVAGIPAMSFLNGIREDPVRKGLLYAATETAVYFSVNDGESWHSLQNNMPVVSVRDIAVHGDDLVIATHGRSWWILDNITPLRELARLGVAPFLFQPQTALRLYGSYGLVPYGSCATDAYGTGDELTQTGTAPNPPGGAMIDYTLAHAADIVHLEILSATGALVRAYRAGRTIKYTKREKGERKRQGYCALSSDPGMHRFAWDLHYTSPRWDDGGGILAPPGRYRVRISANGYTRSAWFTLRKDPRTSASDADLIAQFEAARAIQTLQNRVHALANEATRVQQRLQRLRKHGDASQRVQANRLSAEIAAIVGAAPVAAPDDTDGPLETNFHTIHSVDVTLGDAQALVTGYDAAPPVYAVAAIGLNRRKLDALSAKLQPLLHEAAAL